MPPAKQGRGFYVPFFPWPAVAGVVSNLALATFLAVESGRVGVVAVIWIASGMMLYWGYFRDREEMDRPKEVLMEEALVSVDYSVLVPVADVAHAAELGRLGSVLAREHNGEVLALHVVKVPSALSLSDGRLLLKKGRPPLEKVIEQAKEYEVPVAGGPNGRLALTTAVTLARNTAEPTKVVLLHVALMGSDPTAAEARARNAFRRAAGGVDYPVEERIVTAPTAVEGILQAAGDCDLIVIGASKERLFRNLLLGNVSSRVAEEATCPVMLVKRRSTMLNALLRETVLTPVAAPRKVEELESGEE